jgi:hypothetical protein
MSSHNSYPFNKEADEPREPQQDLGETALEGTQIAVIGESEEYPVEVTTSAEQDELASLGYGQDNRAGEIDPYNQT